MPVLEGPDAGVIAREVTPVTTPGARARGLLGRGLVAEGCLLLSPARQVHTFGLGYPIDVVFLNDRDEVVHLVRSMKPRRVTRWVASARSVLELNAGAASNVEIGDLLVFRSEIAS